MIERWLSAFHKDPQKAINDLFSGRAGLGSGLRLDIPELLYQEFPPLPEFEDARKHLDTALFAWLVFMRKDYFHQVSRLGFAVYSKRLCDCLIAAQVLDLKMFPYQLRLGLEGWLRWMTPLRLAPERDPALECRRLLARYQKDNGQTAAWLRLAGDTRMEYLDVALLGLQNRPINHNAQSNQLLMLVALLIHESACCTNGLEAHSHFKRRFAALRGLYPRGPRYWQQNLKNALTIFENCVQSKTAKELHQILSESRVEPDVRPEPKVFPGPIHEKKDLFNALKSSPQEDVNRLAERFFTIQKQDLRYAEQTGDSYFFARTLSRFGNQLMKQYVLSDDVMDRFSLTIEQGLVWEPYNPFIWMLWADWHSKKGQHQQREWILREAVRLFPANEPSRVELARLLINRGKEHWDEAEQWLREAAERNPANEPSRVELARLLINRGKEHWDEAEQWLREAAERNPANAPSRVELARLLINRGKEHWDEAEQWLREAAERNPAHEPSRVELARLLINRGKEHWDEAEQWLREAAERNPANAPSRVELARLLINRGKEHWDEAEQWLREAAERNPANAPSRVELARLLINRGKEHWDEAEQWLHFTIKEHPYSSYSYLTLAVLLNKKNQYSKAIALLEGFISRIGGNPHIVSYLDRLRTGVTVETDEALEEEYSKADILSTSEKGTGSGNRDAAPVQSDLQRIMKDTAPVQSGLERIMKELKHRASLQAQFMRIRLRAEATDTCDNLRELSEQGDTLAGFFQQWLDKDSPVEIPPNAWAWRACRLYQKGTEEEWCQLEHECTDKIPYTRFLRLQSEENPNDNILQQVGNWIAQQKEARFPHPLDHYIVSVYQQFPHFPPDRSKRDAVVFAVCNASSEGVPEIS